MTWAADDRQYVALNDGLGVGEASNIFYNDNLFSISGNPQNAVFHSVPGYPGKRMYEVKNASAGSAAWYNGWGTLALDDYIYRFMSTFNHPQTTADGKAWPDVRFIGSKLIYSPNNGRTWHNRDGSSPLVWEGYDRHAPEDLIFYDEPQGAFCFVSILQMGRNYDANRDGYIYVYGPNGNNQASMNELVMFRAAKDKLLQPGSYQYFVGLQSNGQPKWTREIRARGVVYTFPPGWVATSPGIPFSWFPSVVYNAPLGVYLMANWGQGWTAEGDEWFGKPSYLGFWVAPNPWGPWTQIHEEMAWLPAGDSHARAYQPQIPAKWIAQDGKSFWLAWDDLQVVDQEAYKLWGKESKQIVTPTAEDDRRIATLMRRARPYYGINAQRVDLIVA